MRDTAGAILKEAKKLCFSDSPKNYVFLIAQIDTKESQLLKNERIPFAQKRMPYLTMY